LSDLDDITAYSIQTWDERQANRYLAMLHGHCQRVADTPALGRRCEHIRPGLWRSEAGSHVLFFRREPDGILVCRILHERMLPEPRPMDDDDDEP
jgi:toxin ParE1/3/4